MGSEPSRVTTPSRLRTEPRNRKGLTQARRFLQRFVGIYAHTSLFSCRFLSCVPIFPWYFSYHFLVTCALFSLAQICCVHISHLRLGCDLRLNDWGSP